MSGRNMNGRFTVLAKGAWLPVHWLVLVVLTELAAGLWSGAETTASEQLLLRATLILFIAVQLQPRPTASGPLAMGLALLWSIGCGLALLVGMVGMVGSEPGFGDALSSAPVLLVATGTSLLVLLFSSATQLLSQVLNDRRRASRLCMLVLLLSVSIPLWAAPFAMLGITPWFADAVIALCPLSYLATLAEIDYLRAAWPYQYLPYGGLRYDYANPVLVTLALLAAMALFTGLSVFRGRYPHSNYTGFQRPITKLPRR